MQSESRVSLTSLESLHEHDRALCSVETSYVPRAWAMTRRLLLLPLLLLTAIVEGMEIDGERMLANLELSRGQLFTERALMKLAQKLGR